MLFMYKDSSNSTRSGVEVFVVTPYSEVDIPFVKLQIYIADSVRTVPADFYAFRVSVFRDGWHVEVLAGVELYTWK